MEEFISKVPVINTETADAHFVGDILDGDPLIQESSHPIHIHALTTSSRRTTTVAAVHVRRIRNQRLLILEKKTKIVKQ